MNGNNGQPVVLKALNGVHVAMRAGVWDILSFFFCGLMMHKLFYYFN